MIRNVGAMLACACVLSACKASLPGVKIGGTSRNDELRREVAELKQQIETLEAQNAELAGKVGELDLARAGSLGNDAVLALPRAVSLEFVGLTGVDVRGDDANAVVYARPLDGRGRFVQVVGEMTVAVSFVPEDPDAGGATPLGGATLGSAAIRDAYREGLGGSSYRFEVPLTGLKLINDDRVVISLVLRDAITGETHRVTETFAVRQRDGAPRG